MLNTRDLSTEASLNTSRNELRVGSTGQKPTRRSRVHSQRPEGPRSANQQWQHGADFFRQLLTSAGDVVQADLYELAEQREIQGAAHRFVPERCQRLPVSPQLLSMSCRFLN